jgi:hypothetical protein
MRTNCILVHYYSQKEERFLKICSRKHCVPVLASLKKGGLHGQADNKPSHPSDSTVLSNNGI